ncbi:MAG: hypothetical protein GY696_18130 [Gammaproteobacteria bacterium]|nr:hypothetical protein [Gammaproteobacteria bacterium]
MKKPRSTCPKGQSPFIGPYRVNQVLGNFRYRLSENQIWNARRLGRYYVLSEWEEEDRRFMATRRRQKGGRPSEAHYTGSRANPTFLCKEEKGLPPERLKL